MTCWLPHRENECFDINKISIKFLPFESLIFDLQIHDNNNNRNKLIWDSFGKCFIFNGNGQVVTRAEPYGSRGILMAESGKKKLKMSTKEIRFIHTTWGKKIFFVDNTSSLLF